MNKTETIKLSTPIMRGEQVIDSIILREPATGDLRRLRLIDVLHFDIDSIAVLLPRISTPALVKEEVYKLSLADLSTVATGITSFLESNESPAA